jgi:Bacterial archaeo-eukaryotic release factor family 11
LGNLAAEAVAQLRDAGVAKREVLAIEQEIGDLIEDEEFWRYLARSLAMFATPERLTTFPVAEPAGERDCRVRPVPSQTSPSHGHVSFARSRFRRSRSYSRWRRARCVSSRSPPIPSPRRSPCLTSRATPPARSAAPPSPTEHRYGGSRAPKRATFAWPYARQIDQALRPLLGGIGVPLILAAAEPLDSIYRSVNSYPQLAAATIAGNPSTQSDEALATAEPLVAAEAK